MTSQSKNDLETQKIKGKAEEENPMKETDQRARKRPRGDGVKDASFKKMGVNQVPHRRQGR